MSPAKSVRGAAPASLLLLSVVALPALAQEPVTAAAETQAAQQSQRGPLVFQPVQNGWVVAPEVKATQLNDRYGTLVGGYVGFLTDESFLVGGSLYWLADGARDRGMTYGGVTLGWFGTRWGAGRTGDIMRTRIRMCWDRPERARPPTGRTSSSPSRRPASSSGSRTG
jgi:hypothetical protein